MIQSFLQYHCKNGDGDGAHDDDHAHVGDHAHDDDRAHDDDHAHDLKRSCFD
jgi:hypothetical protein